MKLSLNRATNRGTFNCACQIYLISSQQSYVCLFGNYLEIQSSVTCLFCASSVDVVTRNRVMVSFYTCKNVAINYCAAGLGNISAFDNSKFKMAVILAAILYYQPRPRVQ